MTANFNAMESTTEMTPRVSKRWSRTQHNRLVKIGRVNELPKTTRVIYRDYRTLLHSARHDTRAKQLHALNTHALLRHTQQ